MIGSRAVSKSVKSLRCSLSVFDTSIFPSRSPSRSYFTTRSLQPPPGRLIRHRRVGRLATERAEVLEERIAHAKEEDTGDHEELLDTDEGIHSKDSIPWYLQVDPPERESTSLYQRQKLPDTPLDSPPLLQPMLEHIFIDLGLDDVTLFDLRNVDPPPALGANLMMVICTARSEKHLNVSADKFCQWMKNTHQITPYADGLLGRGELKLKLKRKAKRARILSRVGSSETKQVDDGIRTGWICVTAENLEDGRPIPAFQRSSDDYVGFGSEEGGAKVVIQMLTQEKREELDLEDLWGKTMQRHERRQDRITQSSEDSASQQEVGQVSLSEEDTIADRSPVLALRAQSMPKTNHSQIRHMHNAATYEGGGRVQGRGFHNRAAVLSPTGVRSVMSQDGVSNSIETDGIVVPIAEDDEQLKYDRASNAGISKLKAHIEFAESLSVQEARTLLGNGAQDTDSTAFLKSFYDALPSLLDAEQWDARLSLLCLGIRVGTPGYGKEQICVLFREIQSSLTEIPVSLYMQTLTTLLSPSPTNAGSDEVLSIDSSTLHAAASILEGMQFHGHTAAATFDPNNQLRELLELAVLQAQSNDDDGNDNNAPSLHSEAPRRLRRLLDEIYPSSPSVDLELRRLHASASEADYLGMWDVWHSLAIDMRPRPAELYVAMLHYFADLNHQAKTMEALRVLVPEMAREEPPVEMDREVAEAVKRCILVVDPRVEEDIVSLYEDVRVVGGDQMAELHTLWCACERVVQEEGRWAREMDDDG